MSNYIVYQKIIIIEAKQRNLLEIINKLHEVFLKNNNLTDAVAI